MKSFKKAWGKGGKNLGKIVVKTATDQELTEKEKSTLRDVRDQLNGSDKQNALNNINVPTKEESEFLEMILGIINDDEGQAYLNNILLAKKLSPTELLDLIQKNLTPDIADYSNYLKIVKQISKYNNQITKSEVVLTSNETISDSNFECDDTGNQIKPLGEDSTQ